jgi:hypothetical protein
MLGLGAIVDEVEDSASYNDVELFIDFIHGANAPESRVATRRFVVLNEGGDDIDAGVTAARPARLNERLEMSKAHPKSRIVGRSARKFLVKALNRRD